MSILYNGPARQIPAPGTLRRTEDPMAKNHYVHGYSPRESERLADQAETLTELLHHDTHYPAGSRVLEAGCGTGAQTVILARNSPEARITSVDVSEDSLRRAQEKVRQEGIANVVFRQGDIFHLPFEPESFDHIFICFVLEHLADPLKEGSSRSGTPGVRSVPGTDRRSDPGHKGSRHRRAS